jgi:hypothetical protein
MDLKAVITNVQDMQKMFDTLTDYEMTFIVKEFKNALYRRHCRDKDVLEKRRQNYQQNKDKILAKKREWYHRNKAKMQEVQ